jgi:hypothetical protein
MAKQTFDELRDRIQEVADHYGGALPGEDAIAWSGYVAALLENSLISPEDHRRLQEFLGPEGAEHVLPIFLGPEGIRESKGPEASRTAHRR